jgi:hypothetical protein
VAELKGIDTGTDLERVYINPDHVTHITPYRGGTLKPEMSLVWLVSGEKVSVEGKPADVEMLLFPFVA